MVVGKDMRNGMTEDERDKFIKDMTKISSMKSIDDMTEQVGKEMRGNLERSHGVCSHHSTSQDTLRNCTKCRGVHWLVEISFC